MRCESATFGYSVGPSGCWVVGGGWWVVGGGWCVVCGGWWVVGGGWWVAGCWWVVGGWGVGPPPPPPPVGRSGTGTKRIPRRGRGRGRHLVDSCAVVRLPVARDHGLRHELLGDGAEELVRRLQLLGGQRGAALALRGGGGRLHCGQRLPRLLQLRLRHVDDHRLLDGLLQRPNRLLWPALLGKVGLRSLLEPFDGEDLQPLQKQFEVRAGRAGRQRLGGELSEYRRLNQRVAAVDDVVEACGCVGGSRLLVEHSDEAACGGDLGAHLEGREEELMLW
jgi:hypothetical protein